MNGLKMFELLRNAFDSDEAMALALESIDKEPSDWKKLVGARPGKSLGSGSFGFVYNLPGPWVLKITQDEHEAEMWGVIQSLPEDLRKGSAQLLKLEPLGSVDSRIHFLVRERIELMISKDPHHYLSVFSGDMIEEEWPENPLWGRFLPETDRGWDLRNCLDAIFRYYSSARALHVLWEREREVHPRFRVTRDDEIETIAKNMRQDVSQWQDPARVRGYVDNALTLLYHTVFGRQLALTLRALWKQGVALNDARDANIGWRYQAASEELTSGLEEDEDPYLIIFDPGFTPSDRRFLPNRRRRR